MSVRFSQNVAICHRCAPRQSRCPHDPERDKLTTHAAESDCPLLKFPPLAFNRRDTPEKVFGCIEAGNFASFPDNWQQFENVQTAYRAVLASVVDAAPAYPTGKYNGRGIAVIGAGVYFASAYVSLRMSRALGDDTPAELWALPGEEIEAWQVKLLDGLNVTVRYPGPDFGAGLRRMGWRLKSYAMIHSRFEQVRLSDADSYPIEDPAYFWDSEEFRRDGAIYFQDRSFQKHDVQRPTYKILGMNDALSESNFESGQFFIDKRRCWRAAWLANWMNCGNSEYFYHVATDLYGDKDIFRIAHRLTKTRFALPPYVDYQSPAFIHYGFDGVPRFVHRVNGKLATRQINYDRTHQINYQRNYALPLEEKAWEFLGEVEAVDPELVKPSLLDKAIHGTVGVAKAIIGVGGVTEEVVAQREAICAQCPHSVMRLGVLAQCKLCGCLTAAKIRNAKEHCPDNPPRWLAVDALPEPPKVTRYTICTYHDDKIAAWAGPAAKVMEAYAKGRGYKFVSPAAPVNPSLPPNWQRVPLLIKELPECDYGIYLDADAVVTNPAFDVAKITSLDPAADLFLASDKNGVNNGVMIWKNTKASLNFLRGWERAWSKEAMCDQRVLRILLRFGAGLKVREVEQRLMNSSVGMWKEGDWLIHYAGIPDKAQAIIRRLGNG